MRILSLLLIAVFSFGISANDYIPVGPYIEKNISPSETLKDPLKTIVRMQFPRTVSTVGQAIELLIKPSGYRLHNVDDNALLYTLPLPESHRSLPDLRLENLIEVLVGEGFKIDINRGLRRIKFTYAGEVSDEEFQQARELKGESSIEPIANYSLKSLPKPVSQNSNLHVVVPGDSIFKIAKSRGVKYTDSYVDAVISNNPNAFIDDEPKSLIVGSTLILK